MAIVVYEQLVATPFRLQAQLSTTRSQTNPIEQMLRVLEPWQKAATAVDNKALVCRRDFGIVVTLLVSAAEHHRLGAVRNDISVAGLQGVETANLLWYYVVAIVAFI